MSETTWSEMEFPPGHSHTVKMFCEICDQAAEIRRLTQDLAVARAERDKMKERASCPSCPMYAHGIEYHVVLNERDALLADKFVPNPEREHIYIIDGWNWMANEIYKLRDELKKANAKIEEALHVSGHDMNDPNCAACEMFAILSRDTPEGTKE